MVCERPSCLTAFGHTGCFPGSKAIALGQAAAKLVCYGYWRRTEGQRSPEEVRWELGVSGKPLEVVTVGRGGDGFVVIEAFLEMMA